MAISTELKVGDRRFFDEWYRDSFMQIALYPGTFDPVTNGHLDVLQRARKLFDRIIIAVSEGNAGKDTTFDLKTRISLLEENVADFEYEFQMAQMNRHLDPGLETIFLMPNEKYFFTSSQLIKQVHLFGKRETDLVPENVLQAFRALG